MEAAAAGPRVRIFEAEGDLQQGVEGELQRQRVDHGERRPGAAPRREARVPRAREDAVPDDRDPRERPGADLCRNKSVSRVTRQFELCTGADGRPVLLEHGDLVEVTRDNAKILVEPVRLAAGQAVDLQLLDEAAAGLDRGSDLRLS